MNMKPPKYAKSVTVTAPDDGVTSIKVTAVYKGNKAEDEAVTITLIEKFVKNGFCVFTQKNTNFFCTPCYVK